MIIRIIPELYYDESNKIVIQKNVFTMIDQRPGLREVLNSSNASKCEMGENYKCGDIKLFFCFLGIIR